MSDNFLYKVSKLAALQVADMDLYEMKEAAISGRAFEIAENLTEEDIDRELSLYEKKEGWMRLVSCKWCGVIYDEDVLRFPDDLYKDDGEGDYEIDETKAVWHNRDYVPFVTCRVCGGNIIKEA